MHSSNQKKNALYRSDDGGFKWKKINDNKDIGNRPFYYSDIYVDPSNENRIYSIFTYVNVSEDGGKSFNQLMPAYGVSNGIHPDHHAWWIHPENPNFMMDGNDGGLNITKDRGNTWKFCENIPVGQFYHINVDNETPYNVYGGMQDNGSWAGPAYVWKSQGIRNHYWQEISFGDGFDVLPHPKNSRYGISTSQQGFAGIYDRKTGYQEIIRPTYPDGEVDLRFNWNVGMSRDPFDANVIYFGSQFVHKSTDGGQNWKIISPDLTTDDKSKQKQHESGGLTMDATGAENYCTILVIEPSPVQQNIIWVGTDDGRVHISKNGGESWTDVSKNLPELPKGSWIQQIKASNKNMGEALLVANDYRRFNYKPYAYRTKDFGVSWQRIVDSNDTKSYVLSIVEDPEESRLLFLGTDDGLYVSIDAGENWTKWDTENFPTTNVYDLVIHPREHDLVIGTFGRAIWILDDIRPLRALARNGTITMKKTLHIFNPPVAISAANQQPKGSRFGGDALYNGENRPRGAMISYVINKPENKEDEIKEASKDREKLEEPKEKDENEIKFDSLTMEFFKDDSLIRTIKQVAPKKNGLHRTYWNMTEKGVFWMSRKELNKKREPDGLTVLPGEYKIRFTYGDQMDSTTVEVEYDPRIGMNSNDIKAKYDALKKLQKKQLLGIDAVERLKEAIKITENIQEKMQEKNKEEFKDQIKLAKNTIDSLNSILDIFVGKVDDRQGITRNLETSISQHYFRAYRYISNALHAPRGTEMKLITKFETEFEKALERVNEFFTTEWSTFREEVEKINLSPFKDYGELKEE